MKSLWVSARLFSLVIPLAIGVSACGSSRYTVLEPPSEPLMSFNVMEIRDFTSNLSDPDSMDLANRFADQLYDAISEERSKNERAYVFTDVVRNTERRDGVLVLDGVVISFEKGSRAKRYFIGFGAGKAFCTIQATFTNKETGATVVKSNFDGELSMSFFGGSPDEAVEAVVEAFIDYFDDYFRNEAAISG